MDARKAMFELNSQGEVGGHRCGIEMFSKICLLKAHIVNSLKVALSVMKSKIIATEKSCIGVILFGAVRVLLLLWKLSL